MTCNAGNNWNASPHPRLKASDNPCEPPEAVPVRTYNLSQALCQEAPIPGSNPFAVGLYCLQ